MIDGRLEEKAEESGFKIQLGKICTDSESASCMLFFHLSVSRGFTKISVGSVACALQLSRKCTLRGVSQNITARAVCSFVILNVIDTSFSFFFYLDAAWLNESRCPGGRPSVSEN